MNAPEGREPVRVHLLGLEPGERFTLSTGVGAEVFTIVDSTRVVDGEACHVRKALGPFGTLELLGDVATRNGGSYFVFPVDDSRARG